eukprot:GHVL01038694.1.p2 GENE.GHVL01038694.1~~GHVL01038694.1.p2  ORF type:complete len:102 (-),score=7.94 GHVL01038694.1:63-368(-)
MSVLPSGSATMVMRYTPSTGTLSVCMLTSRIWPRLTHISSSMRRVVVVVVIFIVNVLAVVTTVGLCCFIFGDDVGVVVVIATTIVGVSVRRKWTTLSEEYG